MNSLSVTIIFLVSVTCLVAVITVSTYNAATHLPPGLQSDTPRARIRVNSQGQLRLAVFADLHYGEEPSTDWGPRQDERSAKVMRSILNWETPDFVIFTGDQLTAESMYPNATAYVHILVKPLVERNCRWASTYGNHDIGPNVTRLEILRAEEKYSNLSYTQRMTNSSVPGVTNYYLLIYPKNETEGEVPVMIWWFMDSQGGRNNEGQQPHYIDPAVIEWFQIENQRMKDLWGPLASLVFFHIPPLEYVAIQNSIPSNPVCGGQIDDDVTPQDNATGIMQALLSAGGVQAVFVGHDHGNSWCCYYGPMQVCYGRHTGYGGYGSWTRGATIVNLGFDNQTSRFIEVRNHLRMETGGIRDRFPK